MNLLDYRINSDLIRPSANAVSWSLHRVCLHQLHALSTFQRLQNSLNSMLHAEDNDPARHH